MSGSRKPLANLAKQIDGVNHYLESVQTGPRASIAFAATALESAVLTTRYTAEAMLENSEARLSSLAYGSLTRAHNVIDSIEPVVWSLADDSITLSRGLIDSAAGQLKAQVEHLLEEVR